MNRYQPQALAGTDDGLLAIGARFGIAAGIGLGQGADGALDGLMGPRRWRKDIRQVPLFIPVPLTAGAGTFTGLIGYQGPPAGWYWSIRRLTAQGFTAGTVSVYDSSINGEVLLPFAQAGTLTGSRGDFLVNPQHYLVVQATGITGTVTIFGRADAVPSWELADYLS